MERQSNRRQMPSSVSEHVGLFDRLATGTAQLVSRAPFFAAAVLLVVAWLGEGVVRVVLSGPKAFLDQVYQLQINTVTTVITFLLVALLQNTQTRSDEALQDKLNAIADALADFMEKAPSDRHEELQQDLTELRDAVGLEDVVSSDDD
jgi:low affinity Fe/Cu permease